MGVRKLKIKINREKKWKTKKIIIKRMMSEYNIWKY